jgi:tetratricopeptide (TPR) repeat protein
MGFLIFILSHTFLVLFSGYWLLRLSQPHNRGSLVWMIGVSLFIPVVAEVLFLILGLTSLKKRKVAGYYTNEEVIPFDIMNYKELNEKVSADYRMMPIMDELREEDNEVKKDLIIRLIGMDVTQKGKYLQVALEHDDAEVVHYAATTLNVLKDKYIQRINNYTLQLSEDNVDAYLQLADTYIEYLNSRLLNKDMRHLVLKEAAGILEKAVRLFPSKPILHEHLGNTYLELGQIARAEVVFQEACFQFPNFCGNYVGLIQAAYKKLDWKAIRQHLQLLDQYIPEEQIPDKWSPVIRQFKGAC